MTLELGKEAVDASMDFAMQTLKRIPRGDKQVLEAHITGVLVVFWGALWGSFGTEYARDFIEAGLSQVLIEIPEACSQMPLHCRVYQVCSRASVLMWRLTSAVNGPQRRTQH